MTGARNLTTRSSLLAVALAVLATSSTIAIAASPAAPVIEKRQANYKKMGAALKTLKDQLSGGSPSRSELQAAANTLAATAKLQPKLFPAGSGPGSGVKTDALPNIWTDRAAFDTAMSELITESGKLAAIAGNGSTAQIQAQYRAVGKTCGGCHRQFRADD